MARRAGLMLTTAFALMLVAAPAHAATFTVNSNAEAADVAIDGTCDADAGPAAVCTLRAALDEANATAAPDAIEFAPISQIELTSALPVLQPVTITGAIVNGTRAPIVQAAGAVQRMIPLFDVDADDVTIERLSISGGREGIRTSEGSENLVVRENDFGLVAAYPNNDHYNAVAVQLEGPNATVRDNEFAGWGGTLGDQTLGVGVKLLGGGGSVAAAGDITRIVGNRFGLATGRPLETAIQADSQAGDPLRDVEIGGSRTTCGGPCNVIAASVTGIDLNTGTTLPPVERVTIRGNAIGTTASETSSLAVGTGIDATRTRDVVVGGSDPADRNVIVAGQWGVTAQRTGSGDTEDLAVTGNTFGLNGAGTAGLSGFSGGAAIAAAGSVGHPAQVTGNLVGRLSSVPVGSFTAGIRTGGPGTVVTGNRIGVGESGQDFGGWSAGVLIDGASPEIGGSAPGAGNVIGNVGVGIQGVGWDGTIRGNSIGVPGAPVSGGAGVSLTNARRMTIGGDDAGGENAFVVSSPGSAIQLSNADWDHQTADVDIRRNRGSASGAFIAFTNTLAPSAMQGGIQPPVVASAAKARARGTAEPGATVRLFASPGPGIITGFLGQAVAGSEGDWEITYADQADGTSVRATQTVIPGKGTSTLSGAAAVDAAGPAVTITAGPTGLTNDATPTLAFTSGEPGATFECRVDGVPAGFAACTSPFTTTPLADGTHTVDVRAVDTLGNAGAAASRTFMVDTTPPVTVIASGPAATTAATSATFAFGGGAAYECSLDGGAFSACASPRTVSGLGAGLHVFRVRARDAAGNVDPTPAEWRWTVKSAGGAPPADTAPPALAIARSAKARKRTIAVTLTCPPSEASGPCTGRLTLRLGRTRLGARSFRIASGATAAVKVRVSAKGAKLVRRKPRLVVATAEVADARGNATTAKRTLRLSGRP